LDALWTPEKIALFALLRTAHLPGRQIAMYINLPLHVYQDHCYVSLKPNADLTPDLDAAAQAIIALPNCQYQELLATLKTQLAEALYTDLIDALQRASDALQAPYKWTRKLRSFLLFLYNANLDGHMISPYLNIPPNVCQDRIRILCPNNRIQSPDFKAAFRYYQKLSEQQKSQLLNQVGRKALIKLLASDPKLLSLIPPTPHLEPMITTQPRQFIGDDFLGRLPDDDLMFGQREDVPRHDRWDPDNPHFGDALQYNDSWSNARMPQLPDDDLMFRQVGDVSQDDDSWKQLNFDAHSFDDGRFSNCTL
jgi:hypothetical protein